MTFRSGGHSGGHWGGFGGTGGGGHWQEHSNSHWLDRQEGNAFNNQQYQNNFQSDLSQSTWNDMRHAPQRYGPQENMSGMPPQGYERMHSAPPPEAVQFANRFLSQPMGAEASFEVHGRHYMARVEPHYHPQGYQGGPNGWHKGVTIYEALSDRYQQHYPNYGPTQNYGRDGHSGYPGQSGFERHHHQGYQHGYEPYGPNGYNQNYSGYESSIGYPPIPGYNAPPEYNQPGYPPIQPGYPQEYNQPGYPPIQPGYPQEYSQPGYPPIQQDYPPEYIQRGYPPIQQGYPQEYNQPGYPQIQHCYPRIQQPGYHPNSGYSPESHQAPCGPTVRNHFTESGHSHAQRRLQTEPCYPPYRPISFDPNQSGSFSNAFSDTTNVRIVAAANADVGQSMWACSPFAPYTQNGVLGCAASVSEVLQQAGYSYANSAGVPELADQLVAKGWHRINVANHPELIQPGDVLYGIGTKPGGSAHIAIVGAGQDGQIDEYDNNSATGKWTHTALNHSALNVVNNSRFENQMWVLRPPEQTSYSA